MLEDKYELRIPSDAIFISGYYDNEWQDGAVHITFKIREDEIDDLFIDNWERSKYLGSEEEKQYSRKYKYQGQMYTGLFCSNSIDGYTTIVFNGRYPGNPIK